MSRSVCPALRMGAVAYDPKVVTIWDGFRSWFRAQGMPFDYVLYSHYEHQVEELLAGHIDIAWNSPLAWVRARRAAAARGIPLSAPIMRDSDRDLTSIVVVRSDSPITSVDGLRGRTLGTGAVDSPQATLLPLDLLQQHGIDVRRDVRVRRFDVGVGLHGDHVGGEREAARALVSGEVDAACLLASNHLAFTFDATLPSGSTKVIAETDPFDHCNMSVNDAVANAEAVREFATLLLSMDYGDGAVRPLLDLEGLKQWLPGRVDGYRALERAVDGQGFYDPDGRITATDYRP